MCLRVQNQYAILGWPVIWASATCELHSTAETQLFLSSFLFFAPKPGARRYRVPGGTLASYVKPVDEDYLAAQLKASTAALCGYPSRVVGMSRF